MATGLPATPPSQHGRAHSDGGDDETVQGAVDGTVTGASTALRCVAFFKRIDKRLFQTSHQEQININVYFPLLSLEENFETKSKTTIRILFNARCLCLAQLQVHESEL